jgi:PGF-CTERM protein
MTTKKGKAIIGLGMAMIMIASVFAVMMPTSALTTPQNNENWLGQGKGNVTVAADTSTILIIGETINFDIPGLSIIGVSEDVEEQERGTTSDEYETSVEFSDGDEAYIWAVDIDGNSKYTKADDMKISLKEPTLAITIKDMKGKSIDSTTKGQNITVDVSSNLFDDDRVKVKISGPEGTWTEFSGNISDADGRTITTNWKTGEYTIWVVTRDDGDDARGVDMSSNTDTIYIRKEEIEIEASTTTPPKEEAVTFTVRGPPTTDFHFSVASHADEVVMTHLEKNPLGLEPGETATMDTVSGKFDETTDEDGIYKFVTKFANDRTYTFQVWLGDATSYGAADTADKDDIDIDVGKIGVTIDVQRTGVIGEDVPITVTADAGDDVDIVIGDVLYFDDETLVDGEATVDWDTAGKRVKTYTIEVFVNCGDLTAGMVGSNVEDEIDDADLDADETATVRLIEPGVTAEQPRDVVADGDDYVIRGTATGVDEVDIVIIGPDGLITDELGVENGLELETGSVSENEFDEEIKIPDGADAGGYVAVVLIPGRDGVYANTNCEDGAFDEALAERRDVALADLADDLEGKNKAQLLEIVEDASFGQTGSDDKYAILTFRVAAPYIDIDEPIATVPAGEPLEISISTNREDDVAITVTSPDCPEFPGATARVEDGKANVTIDTTDVPEGTWTIEAEDDDGNIDEATITIGEAVPPTPTPTPTEMATPTPTEEVPPPTATPTPTETATPTPTEEVPGFGALFAIAGLLAVAYLVLRIKK